MHLPANICRNVQDTHTLSLRDKIAAKCTMTDKKFSSSFKGNTLSTCFKTTKHEVAEVVRGLIRNDVGVPFSPLVYSIKIWK